MGVVVVGAVVALACGSSSHQAEDAGVAVDAAPDAPFDCLDQDLDGFPSAACGGTDCDDGDAAVHTRAECEARCTSDDHAPTCPCAEGEPEPCYSGPAATAGVGICAAGLRECREGAWSACEGETKPDFEICDLVDNDCNGDVDEGLLSACGDCNSDCQELCVGTSCSEPFVPDEGVGLALDDGGCFALEPDSDEGVYEHVWWVDLVGQWTDISYEAELPDGATLELEIRTARTLEELEATKWTRVGTGPADPSPLRLDIGVEADSVLAVRATLRAPDGGAARLCRLAVRYTQVILI